jgi:acyl-[acyl-carrier-protein]-phospholipid O-acyltransferase/long-chain-fatty-acid--[acyl-carrier-protein] ligase
MRNLVALPGVVPFVAVAFINAFVDLGHKIVIQNTVFKCYDGDRQIVLTAIVNALILLPFVLLLTPSGYTSDRYPKHRVIRVSAWSAVALTLLITLCYYQGWFWPAFALTFLLAIQAAFYSPSKYGYIRELVGTNDLTAANGVVQAATTVAMLIGTFVFSVLFEQQLRGAAATSPGAVLDRIAPTGWWLVGAALIEALLAGRLPARAEPDTGLRFDWTRYRAGAYLRANLGAAVGHAVIFQSIVGLAIFWALAQVVLAVFPSFAKDSLALSDTVVIQGMMACAGFGVVAGSLVAARASRNRIETGLIPIGAFGVTATLFLVPLLGSAFAQGANFLALGVFGGLFIVPLNALIQYHAPATERGRILAASNFVQMSVMLAFLGVTVLAAAIGARALLAILGIVALGGALYTVYELPQALARLIATAVIARKYPLDVIGFEHLPERGGVLLLGNHVSWIDWAVLQAACPRPIRFVMDRGIYERWYLRWFLDLFGAVPISGGSSKDALATIAELLNRGEIVCLFPEGTISRTGHLVEFKRGYERAVAGADGVIVPFYLRGLWGSWFSRSSERLRLLRRNGVRRDVIVAFGRPMPLSTPAEALKKRIFELSIESWQRHALGLPSIPAAWLATVKRANGDMALADTLTGTLSATRFAVGVLCLARRIAALSPEPNIGILLPTGAAGAIVNMAALTRSKTVVNLNYTAPPAAVTAALRKAGIRTVYTSQRFLEKLEQRGFALGAALEGVNVVPLETLAAGIPASEKFLTLLTVALLPAGLLRVLYCRDVDPAQPAAILFSSGSEGEPKGVMLSHRNILANVKQISDVLNTRDGDVVMATLPLFHAFGLTVTTFMPLVEGIPVVCHADPTDSLNVAKAIATHRATILCGTSTFLRLYARNPKVHPLMFESLRIVVAGAEKLTADAREAFTLKFHKEIYEGYGATETTPVAGVNLPDQIDTTHWKVQRGNKHGTVGLPLPGTAFRIVDPDSLAELPAGEDGLILIGGAQVMLGYLDDPARTAGAIVEREGLRWYKTGDKGHLDEDGFLTIVDRYSRFAKVGGEMVSLTAVESAVRQVLMTEDPDRDIDIVAVSVPDPRKGEQIVLLSAQAIDADTLRKSLLDAGTPALTMPAQVLTVEAVPKLGSGKTDARAAKELAARLVAPPAN